MMNIKDCFRYGNRVDIEYILEKLFNLDKIYIHLNPTHKIDKDRFMKVISLLNKGYPIEYIFNEVYFYSEKFYIEEGVLIPRDDTEPLIDIIKNEIRYYVKQKAKLPKIAEIGIGSGIISITIKKTYPQIEVIGSDINPLAIKVTQKNLKLHNVNMKLYLTNLLDKVKEQQIEFIISNPPYVEEDWNNEKLKYEPQEAIFAPDNGTYYLKKIVKLAIQKKAKRVICEMGYNHKKIMEHFFSELNLSNYYFYKDLNNNDRGFVVRLD